MGLRARRPPIQRRGEFGCIAASEAAALVIVTTRAAKAQIELRPNMRAFVQERLKIGR